MMDNSSANVGKKQTFKYPPWNIIVNKSHILQSRCTNSPVCTKDTENSSSHAMCDYCKFENELELPQLPEMTFGSNILRLEHDNGFVFEFNAFDALKMVDSKNDLLKVAVAESWQESRMDSQLKDVIKPFDWTYSTNYEGTIFGSEKLKVHQTEERIDIEKLKIKDEILFYEDVILFEDELADNGMAQLSVKIRVMPSSFFVLLRYFLRVDNLIIRIIDTRIYYERNTSWLLREHMMKESKIKDLKVPIGLLGNPQELWSCMPVKEFQYEKLEILS